MDATQAVITAYIRVGGLELMRLTLMQAAGVLAANDQSSPQSGVDFAAAVGRDREVESLATALPRLLPRLWRFAYRLTGDSHATEDLVQKACVRGLERQHQLQPGTSALSWMFSIVHTVWLNEVRARRIRQHASMQWSDELADTVPDESSVSPEMDTLHRQILAAVGQLPDAQRVVMLLVAVEGFSYREAADALDIPIGTVMSRLARARLTIGQALGSKTGSP